MADQTEKDTPPVIVVAMREWWNPNGHTVTTARAVDVIGGRSLLVFPDGHGVPAVCAEICRQWDHLPAGVRFVVDSVRVSRRKDLHTDPHTVNMGRESVARGVTL